MLEGQSVDLQYFHFVICILMTPLSESDKMTLLHLEMTSELCTVSHSLLYHNLEHVGTKSGQLRYWLVKKIYFICMQSKKFKKELMLKFKMISRTCLIFMIAFTVYD